PCAVCTNRNLSPGATLLQWRRVAHHSTTTPGRGCAPRGGGARRADPRTQVRPPRRNRMSPSLRLVDPRRPVFGPPITGGSTAATPITLERGYMNREWSRGESNPRPLECDVSVDVRSLAEATERSGNVGPPGPHSRRLSVVFRQVFTDRTPAPRRLAKGGP